MAEDWLIIGKIVSPQGLKGEVRVLSYSDFPERFENAGKRWIAASENADPQAIVMLSGREIAGKRIYLWCVLRELMIAIAPNLCVIM